MYRFFEILPGTLTWVTLIGMVVLSWKLPVAVAIFIILFDLYFLLKAVYLSFHLRATYGQLKKNLKTDWRAKLNELEAQKHGYGALGISSWNDVYHLVIMPLSTEPYEVVKESFESLLNNDYPKEKFILVLSREERLGDAGRLVAEKIEKEFGGRFFKYLTTVHPQNLPGEIPGKGSNIAWAAQEAKRLLIDALKIPHERVLVSVFDIDTQVPAGYFARLTYAYLTASNPLRAIYQPVPFFTNNVFHTPAFARVVSFSTTFWQMMQQSRPERLTTFSSQSVPFKVLVDIGFWEKHVVSEDSRIFWQCLLHYHGDFRVEPLFYPVSMDANVAPKFWQTLKNLYKQQRRWAWGAENVAYVLNGFRKDRKIKLRTKLYWGFNTLEGYHSWATNSLIVFALGWLPVFLGGRQFGTMLLAYNLPRITRWIVSLSMIGVATSAIMGVALLPPKPKWFRMKHNALYILQWLFLPITLIVFGAVPAIEAQTRLMLSGKFRLGYWITPKSRRSSSIVNEPALPAASHSAVEP